jgi:1-acyl-sn-glycerol-3-phosphate acyltransferase
MRILKACLLTLFISLYALLCLISYLLPCNLRIRTTLTQICSFLCLWALGVKVRAQIPYIPPDGLFVCNHISYIDILVLSSKLPVIFITSNDLRQDFFLGNLSKLAGSLFVERKTNSKVFHDIKVVGDMLKKSHRVVLFPEGTSSSGFKILPFKGALFISAYTAKVPVHLFCLKYDCNESVNYYGDMRFLNRFWELLKIKSTGVELVMVGTLPIGMDSRILGAESYRMIREVYEKNEDIR